MSKKNDSDKKDKTVKLDQETHKLLKIYAARVEKTLGQAVRDLLDKRQKEK